ncbi:unnamed protein product [Larinioides sclopetarius]|uniref:Uncharacterized protein n=1 Tax=Larinioides sclopetarius TaxID=280406 RepID=A0AAV2AZ67_9ARAC
MKFIPLFLLSDYQNYGSCLSKPALKVQFLGVCLAEYAAELTDLGNLDMSNIQDYSDKVMKFICPNRENILNCGYGQVKAACGEPSEKFVRQLIDPFNELAKETCDGASIPSISIALIFLQLLIAMFSSRKIF